MWTVSVQDSYNEFRKHAVQHVAAETMKSLLFIKRIDLINAKSQANVPHGLFGLSLDAFFARRKQNIVYLDVLKLVSRDILERAKICIVLDDVQSFVARLFDGFEKGDMKEILRTLSDAKKMLTIHDQIRDDFKNNVEMQRLLLSKLSAFNVRERQALLYMQSQLYNAQNNCIEAQLVLGPLEYRYKLNFYKGATEQSRQELKQVERNIETMLTRTMWEHSREVKASDSIQTKQKSDIATYRRLLDDLIAKYNTEFDNLDSMITYKINGLGAMREQRRVCEQNITFFDDDKLRLVEWLEEWEKKKHVPKLKSGKKKNRKIPKTEKNSY